MAAPRDKSAGHAPASTSKEPTPRGAEDSQGLVEVVDTVRDSGDGERVRVGSLVQAWGDRAFGPLLLVPALLAVAPGIGAIPGMSIGTAAFIALVAVQRLAGRRSPWLPGPLRRATLPQRHLDRGVDWLRPYVARLETVLRPRWQRLARPPFAQLIALLCIVLAMLMVPLAFVPFGVALPGAAIAILAAGVTVQDGLVVSIGCGAGLGACGAGAVMLVG